ncbi:MAG TPA: DUF4838 domain-containing protein [Candidatus Hydrogenedentes bacterium]|nr:DUF4838 domain-containing protein [Candidatus Hydrogenedentota bacterium]
MRYGAITAWVAVLAAVGGCAGLPERPEAAGALTLADSGKTDFTIVVADTASPSTRYGAEELQRFLGEISGAEFAIVSDSTPMAAHEIVLGNNAHLAKLDTAIDFNALGNEGYVIRTVGPHLVIAGGDLRGNLYGVYGLLEDHLGCRWFTPEVSRIPKRERLTLPELNDTQIPVLEYREPFTIDCFDGDWCARNRMNSSTGRLEERHGGKVRFGAGMFVHTFNGLVPPDKYFDEHPEYFSEINGQRVKDHSQLCCTNEDVIALCTEGTLAAIRSDPDAFVFSVSQNDWGNYCQCAKCQALAEAEGSQMAPVLHLVNRVAEAVEKEFPDKAIETLAYQWTRKAPKTMRPRSNVIVRLCSIECCFMHPLATCDLAANRDFRRDAEDWAKVADRLWVWDYVTSFRHYMCPFPNLRVRNDNIQFFEKNNVRGIFEQDNYQSLNGELSGLSGYITAKFLWNAAYNEDTAINEFLEGVYGDAAKPIRRYIDLLHDKVERENIHTNIWIGPNEAGYLDDAILAKSDRLWDKAEKAVADQPEVLERVRIARLPVEYAWIERARVGGRKYLVNAAKGAEGYEVRLDPEFAERVQGFFDVARRANVTRLDEGRTSMDQYQEQFEDVLDNPTKTLALLEPVAPESVTPGLSFAYYEGAFVDLPDFASLTPDRSGVIRDFGLDVGPCAEQYAIRFEGYVKVRHAGVYTFYVTSNDGAQLLVGDHLVVDNGGQHGTEQRAGVVALQPGFHPIVLKYFQAGGEQALEVNFEGPSTSRRPIHGALYHGE